MAGPEAVILAFVGGLGLAHPTFGLFAGGGASEVLPLSLDRDPVGGQYVESLLSGSTEVAVSVLLVEEEDDDEDEELEDVEDDDEDDDDDVDDDTQMTCGRVIGASGLGTGGGMALLSFRVVRCILATC